MFPAWICKRWTFDGLKTSIREIDARISIERRLVAVGCALFDVEYLLLYRESFQDYKLVLCRKKVK